MSRYYDIAIYNKDGEVVRPASLASLRLPSTYTSFVNGKTLPGALNIEIQVQAFPFAVPKGGSFVRVWGISIDEISRANDLVDLDITVKAGMQKGLPLARPQQAGVIAQGKIFQSNGNWIGLDKTLDIIVVPTDTKPKDLAFVWKRKQPISDAIRSTLGTAFPDLRIVMAVSDQVVAQADMVGTYKTLPEFSEAIKKVTRLPVYAGIRTQSGTPYAGVDITKRDKVIIVYDGTADYGENSFANPKQIDFIDLVGQPTWITAQMINVKTVMRADIQVGDYVKLPKELSTPFVLTGQGAGLPGSAARNKLAFQGVFEVRNLYHWGNYRVPSADAWVTTFDAAFAPASQPLGLLGPI